MFNVYLDDIRAGPYNDFNFPNSGWENWVVVRHVSVVQELLNLGLVRDLSLDHDLGINVEESTEHPNGSVLVRWMIETGTWPSGMITIHSQNLLAAQQMKADIDKFRPPF
jgi:hypothetical protein